MDTQKVDMYIMTHAKHFEPHQLATVRDMMMKADDTKFMMMQSIDVKDPTMILIISILAGSLGIDRFMIGDTGLGIAKLLTCGGLGIWAIVDWFIIQSRTKEKNFENFQYAMM